MTYYLTSIDTFSLSRTVFDIGYSTLEFGFECVRQL